MKTCTNSGCPYKGEPQPIINFTSQLHTKDGLRTHCKRCRYLWQAKYSKEYRANILRLNLS